MHAFWCMHMYIIKGSRQRQKTCGSVGGPKPPRVDLMGPQGAPRGPPRARRRQDINKPSLNAVACIFVAACMHNADRCSLLLQLLIQKLTTSAAAAAVAAAAVAAAAVAAAVAAAAAGLMLVLHLRLYDLALPFGGPWLHAETPDVALRAQRRTRMPWGPPLGQATGRGASKGAPRWGLGYLLLLLFLQHSLPLLRCTRCSITFCSAAAAAGGDCCSSWRRLLQLCLLLLLLLLCVYLLLLLLFLLSNTVTYLLSPLLQEFVFLLQLLLSLFCLRNDLCPQKIYGTFSLLLYRIQSRLLSVPDAWASSPLACASSAAAATGVTAAATAAAAAAAATAAAATAATATATPAATPAAAGRQRKETQDGWLTASHDGSGPRLNVINARAVPFAPFSHQAINLLLQQQENAQHHPTHR